MARKFVTIDWKTVDDLLMSGCSGYQIASYLGVHDETLFNHTVREKKMSWADYSAKFRSKGDALLYASQFKKAIKGDNTMLVWLGKNRLKQKENHDNGVIPNDKVLEELLNEVKQSRVDAKRQADSKLSGSEQTL